MDLGKKITLQTIDTNGREVKATFLEELGLNLASLTLADEEFIDQNTLAPFEERFSGLGPIIGPHFHRQDPKYIQSFDESLFPHIARVKKRGQKDPFSHGIARYVPWNISYTENSLRGHLSGTDKYKGVFLKDLEGCDFSMNFEATLDNNSLLIDMDVEADRESVCGLHYFFRLDDQHGLIEAPVQHEYNDQGSFKPIPDSWFGSDKSLLEFDLKNEADYGFLPLFENFSGWAHLKTGNRGLKLSYQGENGHISMQIYSPKDATFVCIEPISAKNPRGLTETKSSFTAKIELFSA